MNKSETLTQTYCWLGECPNRNSFSVTRKKTDNSWKIAQHDNKMNAEYANYVRF